MIRDINRVRATRIRGNSAADMNHGSGGLEKTGLSNVVASFLFLHCTHDEAAQILIRSPIFEQTGEIVLRIGKQAGPYLPIGSQSDSAACPAEGLRDRRNDPNFTNSVGKTVTPSRLTSGIRRKKCERSNAVQPLDDLPEAYNQVRTPESAFLKRHEFDKPDNHILSSRELSEGFNLVVVKSPKKYTVDFDPLKSSVTCSADTALHGAEAARNARHPLESRLFDRVHAYRDSAQSRRLQRLCEAVKQVSVCCDRQVEWMTGGCAPLG